MDGTTGGDRNPFVAFRHHLDVYRAALDAGLDDAAFVALVERADARVAAVAGRGFRVTPLVDLAIEDRQGGDLGRLGPIVAKVETANVSGSHKARHLFGLLLYFLMADQAHDERGQGGKQDGPHRSGERPPLAIASCGNAALGAAVVAASAGRRLLVFVPVEADPVVVDQLDRLGADVRPCPRQPGREGDPCVLRLHEALAAGAVPFTVQGPLAPAVIDGARTLGLELADQLEDRGQRAADIYIQIGGGALATAVMDGLARHPGTGTLPRLHPVQATAAHPYIAGWHRIAPALLARLGQTDPGSDHQRALALTRALSEQDPSAHPGKELDSILEDLAGLMTPWPDPPRSVAGGILDDLTYDWRTVMAHQIRSGGWPQPATEATLSWAAELAARQVTPPPDATGAAGLAGLLDAAHAGDVPPHGADEVVVVVLSGVDRRWSPAPA